MQRNKIPENKQSISNLEKAVLISLNIHYWRRSLEQKLQTFFNLQYGRSWKIYKHKKAYTRVILLNSAIIFMNNLFQHLKRLPSISFLIPTLHSCDVSTINTWKWEPMKMNILPLPAVTTKLYNFKKSVLIWQCNNFMT